MQLYFETRRGYRLLRSLPPLRWLFGHDVVLQRTTAKQDRAMFTVPTVVLERNTKRKLQHARTSQLSQTKMSVLGSTIHYASFLCCIKTLAACYYWFIRKGLCVLQLCFGEKACTSSFGAQCAYKQYYTTLLSTIHCLIDVNANKNLVVHHLLIFILKKCRKKRYVKMT